MIIDDDQIDQMMYDRVIKRSGLIKKTVPFLYAEKALNYLKAPESEPIHMIFLDINMPRMNGFEFLDRAIAELGTKFTNLVVVMLTTSLHPDDKARADSYGVVKHFMAKPLNATSLQKVVSAYQTTMAVKQ